MSKKTFCDITNCEKNGKTYQIDLVETEIVPTGNSDYSAYEEKTLKRVTLDLCETHAQEYQKRIERWVAVRDSKGVRFP